MTKKRYLSADEAAETLSISKATLYAYVSRGLVRSEQTAEHQRQRRYLAEDIHRLRERKAQRQDPGKAAKDALNWGMPVMESGLTLITETALYYRGYDVLALAREQSFEAVASLLWTGSFDAAESLFLHSHENDNPQPGPIIPAMQIALALASESDLYAYDTRPEAALRTGVRILRLLTTAVTGHQNPGKTAQIVTAAWSVENGRLIEAALIVCADHELNASSFAARVVASTGANLYAVVSGGLAALQGFRHGGNTRRVAALLREIDSTGDVRRVIGDTLRRGEGLPGFGHTLYPAGDPRGRLLLELLGETEPENAEGLQAAKVAREVAAITGEAPNVDFALVVLERALKLLPDSALALFALGRTVGWIAHGLEQYAAGHLIRPRARYVGPPV